MKHDSSTVWDSRYSSRRGMVIPLDSDPWLDRWNDILETARTGQILERGCGSGRDSRYLTGLGFDVIAVDSSKLALEVCRDLAPLADLRLIDIRKPLPFEGETFPIITASLCLHYFSWQDTMKIMSDVRRCLKPGGFLLVRVNATGDVHYGSASLLEIEPGLYSVDGELKRFFDRKAMERLIGAGWRVHSLEELTVHRYEAPKVLWETVLVKV